MTGVASLCIVVGVAFGFLPVLPGFVLLLPGLGLLAAQSRLPARFLDRTER